MVARVLLALGLAVVLLVAACDRSSGPTTVSVAAPETLVTLPSCDSLADTTVDLLQAYLDAVAGMTLDELLDPAVSGARLADLDAASAALTARAGELGCDEADLAAFVAGRYGDLRADSPLAERFLDVIAERVGVAP